MGIVELATHFSQGEFNNAYKSIAEDAVWTVVEENQCIGKQAILEKCEQVDSYFRSVTTHFKILHIISNKQNVAITGTAEFIKDRERVSFISSCDIYEFNSKNQIQKITSYCIPAK